MKIHTRILLILVATALVVLVAMIILALFFVLPGFTQLEEKESLINLKRVTGQIESEKENIGELTQDLVVWDDTYRYMADRNPAYVQSVLDRTSTFESIQVQGVLYYDTAGNYFDGRWYTQGNNSPDEVSANLREYFARHATLLNSSAAGTTSTGFILLPGGSYLVACTRLCPAVEMDPPGGYS